MSAITDGIDNLLAAYLPTISQRQADFYALTGDYFQGLPTHTTPPADGAMVLPDNLDTVPIGQPVPWPGEDFPAQGLPCSVRLDIYVGPSGAGWVLTAEVVIGGVLWRRAINVGPETYRAHGWQGAALVME